MEIREMSFEDIEARRAELKSQLEERAEGIDLEGIDKEINALEEREAELKLEAEKRAKEEEEALKAAEVKSNFEENEMEKRIYGPETTEYRDAFYAVMFGEPTAEQREITVDSTSAYGGGDALVIPKTLDTKIWDGIHEAHPILADINVVASGMAMEVTKHTAIATRVSAKKDAAATGAEESNTFVKVTLVGKDYEKYVTLSYAEAKMSQGALEDYLAQEIADELGEALAKDVFAQIIADAGTGQKVTPDGSNPDLFGDLKSAMAKASQASAPVVYAPADKYYEIIGAIKQGSPFNMAATLGVQVKLDNAATKVTVVDPKMFLLNQVQGVLIETDKDIKAHKVIVSGYMRAEGTLRKSKAAAYIN